MDYPYWTGFEAPDPVFWTDAGYVVVQADTRGMHKSEGHAGVDDAEALGLDNEGDELDLFVVLRKWDTAGREVPFYGYNGFDRDGVTKGWLRLSHRALDVARSRPGRPWHSHLRRQPVGAERPVSNDTNLRSVA